MRQDCLITPIAIVNPMLPLALGFLLAICVMAIASYIGRREGREEECDSDPRVKLWSLEILGRRLLGECLEMNDLEKAKIVQERLDDLALVRFAQGWGKSPTDNVVIDEDARRSEAQWN